jgi:hypothetical protein
MRGRRRSPGGDATRPIRCPTQPSAPSRFAQAAARDHARITVRTVAGEPYDRITDYELGPVPEPVPAEVLEFHQEAPDEIPF